MDENERRGHKSFLYTFWEEIPWVEGCEDCMEIKPLGPAAIGRVTNHWHRMWSVPA